MWVGDAWKIGVMYWDGVDEACVASWARWGKVSRFIGVEMHMFVESTILWIVVSYCVNKVLKSLGCAFCFVFFKKNY